MPKTAPKNEKSTFLFKGLILPLIFLIILAVYLLFFGPEDNFFKNFYWPGKTPDIKTQELEPSPKPKFNATEKNQRPVSQPIFSPRPIKSGRHVSKISGGIENAPRFVQVEIDEADPAQADSQTLTVKIESDTPVKTAKLTVLTDNQAREIPLELTSGEKTNGQWQATWTVNDSFLYRYKLNIEASNDAGTQETALLLR